MPASKADHPNRLDSGDKDKTKRDILPRNPPSIYPRGYGINRHKKNFSNGACINDDDPSLPQSGKPSRQFPYGVNRFLITGLSAGESVTLSIDFPEAVSTTAQYYKPQRCINNMVKDIQIGVKSVRQVNGEKSILAATMATIGLPIPDPLTDADGIENGTIDDPGALTTATSTAASSSGSGGVCFVSALLQ